MRDAKRTPVEEPPVLSILVEYRSCKGQAVEESGAFGTPGGLSRHKSVDPTAAWQGGTPTANGEVGGGGPNDG